MKFTTLLVLLAFFVTAGTASALKPYSPKKMKKKFVQTQRDFCKDEIGDSSRANCPEVCVEPCAKWANASLSRYTRCKNQCAKGCVRQRIKECKLLTSEPGTEVPETCVLQDPWQLCFWGVFKDRGEVPCNEGY